MPIESFISQRYTRTTSSYNLFQNILRYFNVLPNFLFTASEMMGDYYLSTQFIRAVSRVAKRLSTYDPRKLENVRKVYECHIIISW